MTRVLLDTSAYAGFMKGKPDLKTAIQQAEEIYFNPIILGELFAGFMKGKYKRNNEEELEHFLASPRTGIVPIDEETSYRYAAIQNMLWSAGTPIPSNDMWIAASAMQYGLRVLTTDAHFQKVHQILIDYFPAG